MTPAHGARKDPKPPRPGAKGRGRLGSRQAGHRLRLLVLASCAVPAVLALACLLVVAGRAELGWCSVPGGLAALALAATAVAVPLALRAAGRLVSRLEAADEAADELRGQLWSAAKLASVGEMAAGVAHEINNPLAIIHEEAGMMLDVLDPTFGLAVEPDEFRERLTSISDAAMRGRGITRKLLAFARRHEPAPEKLDVNHLLDAVLAMKKVDFSVSNVEVERRFEPSFPCVSANRNELEQVLLNLLNNARDAIGRGGRVTLSTRLEGGEVLIDVEDTGHGIPPELVDRIFEPFFTTKAVGKGTGLGLSISQGIVASMGGRIEVRSEPGAGTTFTVALPAAAYGGSGNTTSEDGVREQP